MNLLVNFRNEQPVLERGGEKNLGRIHNLGNTHDETSDFRKLFRRFRIIFNTRPATRTNRPQLVRVVPKVAALRTEIYYRQVMT